MTRKPVICLLATMAALYTCAWIASIWVQPQAGIFDRSKSTGCHAVVGAAGINLITSERFWSVSLKHTDKAGISLSLGDRFLFATCENCEILCADPSTCRQREFHVPFWLVLPLMLAYPGIAFVRGPLRRWRIRWPGLCPQCGYDLTGNTSGRCSECGGAAPTEQPAPKQRRR